MISAEEWAKSIIVYPNFYGYQVAVPNTDALLMSDAISVLQSQEDINLDIVLDIGAHVGLFSIYAISRGAKQVIAFEPCYENFNILVFNIASNDLWGKIIPIPLAVVACTFNQVIDYQQLKFASPNKGMRSIAYNVDKFDIFQWVGAISMASVLSAMNHIDYLKMDIEGAEWDIFAQDLDWGNVDIIEMETHSWNDPAYFGDEKHPMEDLLETHLMELGYNVEKTMSKPSGYPGLLCRRMK